jgi:hypothetical protein
MPRHTYESGFEDDDFELPETYQPIKPSRRVYSSKQSGNSRSNAPRRDRSKQLGHFSAKRSVVASQQGVLATVVAEALGARAPSAVGISPTKLYVAVAGETKARAMFDEHFAPGHDRRKARVNFNETADAYLREANRARPTISARLGELDILGALSSAGHGPSFVGVRLEGDGGDALIAENSGLLAVLNAAKLCTSPIRQQLYNDDPYLRLAMTRSYEAAEALLAQFQDSCLVLTMRNQLTTPDNPESLVTFGPAAWKPQLTR